MRAHWRHLANTIKVVFLRLTRIHNQTVNRSVQIFFAQLTAESPYEMGTLFPENFPFLWGGGFLGPMYDVTYHSVSLFESNTQTAC